MPCAASLLEQATFVFQPSGCVMSLWVVMCPVNRSTQRAPVVFAEEANFVAHLEGVNSRRQINIVRNLDGLARFQPNDKPLMPASIVIIRQELNYRSCSFDLKTTLLLSERPSQTLVTFTSIAIAIDRRRRCAPAEVQ